MSFKFQHLPGALRPWITAHLACLVTIAVSLLIGFILFLRIGDVEAAEDDRGWVVFQLGLEHQRLLLAAEKGDSLDEIRLRGDIYLSRVIILRDSSMMAAVRKRLDPYIMTSLLQSAQATERLLRDAVLLENRYPLLAHLRSDAPLIHELMIEIYRLKRSINLESRARDSRNLLLCLAALEVLMLALIGLSVIVFRTMRRLRAAGRELATHFANQNAILNSVDTAILGLGPQGEVLYSNPNAQALLGADASTGARLRDHSGEQGLAGAILATLSDSRDCPAGGAASLRKVHLSDAAGMRRYVIRACLTQSAPEPGEALDRASHIVTVTDVTAEEESQLRREEYDASIGEASRVLAYAAISGGIVHEISQPLAAIRNYAYALQVSLGLRQENDEHRAIAANLGREIDRAIEVVRNVRRMGPQGPQDSGLCDVQEAITHSVGLATLGSNPPPPIAVMDSCGQALVAGTLPMVGQVVVNLLKNALSASAAADRQGAEVSITRRGDHAEIAVADFGTGVSPEAAKSLFSPFSKSARGGMGLGLAICQRIAATLGGSLSWENRETGGAIFRFTVPLAKEGSTP